MGGGALTARLAFSDVMHSSRRGACVLAASAFATHFDARAPEPFKGRRRRGHFGDQSMAADLGLRTAGTRRLARCARGTGP